MLGFGKKKTHTIDGLNNYEIPSFSASVITLLGKLRDPDCSFTAIADDLEVDPGLHVRVLKTVNAVAFGLTHTVSSIHHAVSLLGRARLESLVLSVAVKNNLGSENMPDWFDMQLFWRASARRAALARSLAQKLHPETQSESFTAGLLQDMAVPVIAQSKTSNYQKIYEPWNLVDNQSNLIELEQHNLNLDHANIGAQMARNWGFPANLIEMISSHHTTKASLGTPLSVQIVALLKGNPEIPLVDLALQVEQLFNLDQSLYCQLAEQAQEDADELIEALR